MYRAFLLKIGAVRKRINLTKYTLLGSIPFSKGYMIYRDGYIHKMLNSNNICERFRSNKELPKGYGLRLDERVIEYPWVISRLIDSKTNLMDAGSTLNRQILLDLPIFSKKTITIYTLAPEGTTDRVNVSYIYGDLRNTIIKDGMFEEIICISTLEHVGMNNTLIYANDPRLKEYKPNDYLKTVIELKRLLKHGGKLFITVPYGYYENHGWLQQFDSSMIYNIISEFNGISSNVVYYKYSKDGWQISLEEDCNECSYFDIHNRKEFESDYVAAARSVACLELYK